MSSRSHIPILQQAPGRNGAGPSRLELDDNSIARKCRPGAVWKFADRLWLSERRSERVSEEPKQPLQALHRPLPAAAWACQPIDGQCHNYITIIHLFAPTLLGPKTSGRAGPARRGAFHWTGTQWKRPLGDQLRAEWRLKCETEPGPKSSGRRRFGARLECAH